MDVEGHSPRGDAIGTRPRGASRVAELWGSGLFYLGGVGLCGCLSACAPGSSLAVAALWTGLRLLGGRAWLWGLAGALLFVVSGVRAQSAVESFIFVREQARQQLQGIERCSGRVTVISSPTWESGNAPGTESRLVWLGQAESLECGASRLAGPVMLRLGSAPSNLARGDELELILQVGVLQLFQNQGLPDPRPGAARRRAVLTGSVVAVLEAHPSFGLLARIDRARAQVRARIFATYRQEVVPLARALVLGESDLNEEESLAFSKSGLMHILAVSGTHLVLAVVTLERALFALLVRISRLAGRFDVGRASGLLGAALAFLYADFAGGSGSAFRAAFMLAIVLGGRFLGYRVRGGAALGASLLIGLALDPLVGHDISFLLSALATLGLLALAAPLVALLERSLSGPAWLRWGLEALIMTLSSSVACAPLLALLGGQMTWAGLVANLVAGPAGEMIALPACLLHTVASVVPPLERGLAFLGGGALFIVRGAALWSASLEALAFRLPLPGAYEFVALSGATLLLGASFAQTTHRRWLRHALLGGALGFLGLVFWSSGADMAPGWPTRRRDEVSPDSATKDRLPLRITALDVGQGDALFLEFPNGQVGLLDGGGYPQNRPSIGERVLLPFLRARGLESLDLLILSHPDRDHMLGLREVSEQLAVKEFWYPGRPGEDSTELRRLLVTLAAQGTRIVSARELCGQARDLGALAFVLAPCDDALELDRNDASLVLKLSHGIASALLTGDVEEPGEKWLVQMREHALRADLLKVGHHGSRTSSSAALLGLVRPQVAFISVGSRNTFGHPAREVLSRLGEGGARVFRSDELGSLTWSTDGQSAWVESFREPEPELVPLGDPTL